MPAALTTSQPAGPFEEGKRRIAAAIDGARTVLVDRDAASRVVADLLAGGTG